MLLYQFMHSSESILGVRENFHSIHPSGVYTFFSTKPFVLIGESFSKKSWKLFLSKSVPAFQPKDIFFVLVCFFCFFLGILLPKHTYIHTHIYIYIYCEVSLLYTCISKVFSLPKHIYIYFVRYDYLLSLCLFYLSS